MMDSNAIPQVFEDERKAKLGDELPTELTIKLSPQLAAALYSRALVQDRDYDWVARQLLEVWAEKQLESARLLAEVFAERPVRDEPASTKKKPEREYTRELAAAIEARGFRAQLEYDTGAGDADIAVFADGQTKPLGIVEVKVSLLSWREVHHASGQAMAYAKSAGAKLWFVTAPTLDPRFVSAKVLPFAEASGSVTAAVAARLTA